MDDEAVSSVSLPLNKELKVVLRDPEMVITHAQGPGSLANHYMSKQAGQKQ